MAPRVTPREEDWPGLSYEGDRRDEDGRDGAAKIQNDNDKYPCRADGQDYTITTTKKVTRCVVACL